MTTLSPHPHTLIHTHVKIFPPTMLLQPNPSPPSCLLRPTPYRFLWYRNTTVPTPVELRLHRSNHKATLAGTPAWEKSYTEPTV